MSRTACTASHWEWVNDEVGGERVTLCEADGQGFVQELRWTDYAAFASYLTYTPPEAKALLTNGDILVARDSASAASMVISDYPDLYTDSMIRYQSGAYDFFDETVIRMMTNTSLTANWEFDAKTWKTDWMQKMYSVSDAMRSAWDSFVSEYNGAYSGSVMEQEYNAAVQSGDMKKVEMTFGKMPD